MGKYDVSSSLRSILRHKVGGLCSSLVTTIIFSFYYIKIECLYSSKKKLNVYIVLYSWDDTQVGRVEELSEILGCGVGRGPIMEWVHEC